MKGLGGSMGNSSCILGKIVRVNDLVYLGELDMEAMEFMGGYIIPLDDTEFDDGVNYNYMYVKGNAVELLELGECSWDVGYKYFDRSEYGKVVFEYGDLCRHKIFILDGNSLQKCDDIEGSREASMLGSYTRKRIFDRYGLGKVEDIPYLDLVDEIIYSLHIDNWMYYITELIKNSKLCCKADVNTIITSIVRTANNNK